MKTCIKIGVASALALSLASAFASQTTTMKVDGKISASACQINMPNGQVSNFGNLTDADFVTPEGYFPNRTLLKDIPLSVAVNCPSETFVALKFTDNNASSLPTDAFDYPRLFAFDLQNLGGGADLYPDNWFGLGFASNGVPIGAYAIGFGAITVDSDSNIRTLVSIEGRDWGVQPTTQTFFDKTAPYLAPGSADAVPIAGKQFNFPLRIAVNLNPANVLPANESLKFDASTTIEVVYL